ncbi:MAG TPA: COX15/CtaA family protein, partial [Luteimonas sp.]|nr:COX15/CtaA family protein [Luteimonas sp.]
MSSTPRPALYRPAVYRHFHRLAWLACALAFGVIVFGAFVRLSNAGLSCPDWPTCYGSAAWPTDAHQSSDHAATAIRPVEVHKAWREQLHRMLAGSLGVLVLALALLAARRRRHGIAQILVAAAAVGMSIALYMRGQHVPAAVLAAVGEGILLFAALRWSNLDLARISTLTLAVIVFQALLGMWTVTWLLKPVVVMGHLLGGLATFAL